MLVALMWQGSGARKAGNYFAPRRRLEEYWDFYLVELSTKSMDFAVEYSTKGHVFAVEYSTKGTAFAVECSTKRHVSWFNSARSLLRFWLNVRPGDRFQVERSTLGDPSSSISGCRPTSGAYFKYY